MNTTAQSIAQEHASTRDPRLAGIHATIVFDVAGAGVWYLRIEDGRAELSQIPSPPDLTISCDEAGFVGLVTGELNPLTAMLRGDIELMGELALAFKLYGLAASTPGEVAP